MAATAGPVETVMTQPGSEAAVRDEGEAVDRVEAQHGGDELEVRGSGLERKELPVPAAADDEAGQQESAENSKQPKAE